MDPLLGSTIALLAAHLAAVVALGLRLRSQTRQLRTQHHLIETLARELPPGSRFEEHHPDGRRIVLTLPGTAAR